MWCLRLSTVESTAPMPGAHPTTSHTSQQPPRHWWAKEVSLQGDGPLREQKEQPVLPLHSKGARERPGEHTAGCMHACIRPWSECHIFSVPLPLSAVRNGSPQERNLPDVYICTSASSTRNPREARESSSKTFDSDPQEKGAFNPES